MLIISDTINYPGEQPAPCWCKKMIKNANIFIIFLKTIPNTHRVNFCGQKPCDMGDPLLSSTHYENAADLVAMATRHMLWKARASFVDLLQKPGTPTHLHISQSAGGNFNQFALQWIISLDCFYSQLLALLCFSNLYNEAETKWPPFCRQHF